MPLLEVPYKMIRKIVLRDMQEKYGKIFKKWGRGYRPTLGFIIAINMGISKFVIDSDALLVIKAFKGEWRMNWHATKNN